MKRLYLIVFLIFLFPIVSFGQLRGEYCHNFGFGTECIKFLEQNRFEYTHDHCTGSDRGIGKYRISGGTLTLNFETDTSTFRKHNLEISDFKAQGDSVNFDILAIDTYAKEPVIFANTYLSTSNNNLVKYSSTDIEGKSQLKVPNSSDTLIFSFITLGYKPFAYKIVPNKNYKLRLNMYPGVGRQYKPGDIISFKIKRLRLNSINLKHNYYSEAQFEKYTKED